MELELNFDIQTSPYHILEAFDKIRIFTDANLNEYLKSVDVKITDIYRNTEHLFYIPGSIIDSEPKQYVVHTTNGAIPVNVSYKPKDGLEIHLLEEIELEYVPDISQTVIALSFMQAIEK